MRLNNQHTDDLGVKLISTTDIPERLDREEIPLFNGLPGQVEAAGNEHCDELFDR